MVSKDYDCCFIEDFKHDGASSRERPELKEIDDTGCSTSEGHSELHHAEVWECYNTDDKDHSPHQHLERIE